MGHHQYPFPVHMTDFVVLALCASAMGTNVFEEGTAAEKKAAGTAHVYHFGGRRLMLDGLVLREDMDDGWALAEAQRGAHKWPTGEVGNGFSVPIVKSSRSGAGASGAAGADGGADPSDGAPLVLPLAS